MANQGQYPIGNRMLAGTDTLTGVVTGATADIPLAMLLAYVVQSLSGGSGSVGPTSGRPTTVVLGQFYLDTTIDQPIWAFTTTLPIVWRNAAGVPV
jgi:hypothetical protein